MEEYDGVVVHCPMRDEDDFTINERSVRAAAEAAIEMYRLGGKVLIHCTGGLNRSSVVTAMMLLGLGHTRREAVTIIRAQHDSMCLCNRAFERWVLNEPLPTAETSTFRERTDLTDGNDSPG